MLLTKQNKIKMKPKKPKPLHSPLLFSYGLGLVWFYATKDRTQALCMLGRHPETVLHDPLLDVFNTFPVCDGLTACPQIHAHLQSDSIR